METCWMPQNTELTGNNAQDVRTLQKKLSQTCLPVLQDRLQMSQTNSETMQTGWAHSWMHRNGWKHWRNVRKCWTKLNMKLTAYNRNRDIQVHRSMDKDQVGEDNIFVSWRYVVEVLGTMSQPIVFGWVGMRMVEVMVAIEATGGDGGWGDNDGEDAVKTAQWAAVPSTQCKSRGCGWLESQHVYHCRRSKCKDFYLRQAKCPTNDLCTHAIEQDAGLVEDKSLSK